jgi:hypothetical protein
MKQMKKAKKVSVAPGFPSENDGHRLEAVVGSGQEVNFPPELHT